MSMIPNGGYTVKKPSSGNNLPVGTYNCQVTETGVDKNNGGEFLRFNLKVLDGPCAGRVQRISCCYVSYNSDPKTAETMQNIGTSRLDELANGCGYPVGKQMTDTDELLWKTVTLIIAENKKNPDYPYMNFKPYNNGGMSAVPQQPTAQPQMAPQMAQQGGEVPGFGYAQPQGVTQPQAPQQGMQWGYAQPQQMTQPQGGQGVPF